MEDNVKLDLCSRQLMLSQSTERKKNCHSQTRLVCDPCCALVNYFFNRTIVTTCPYWKLAPVYPKKKFQHFSILTDIKRSNFIFTFILLSKWYICLKLNSPNTKLRTNKFKIKYVWYLITDKLIKLSGFYVILKNISLLVLFLNIWIETLYVILCDFKLKKNYESVLQILTPRAKHLCKIEWVRKKIMQINFTCGFLVFF